MSTIDLRSDTVTRPSAKMRQAMADAEVGDDVYGDDPTVNRLQELAAEATGMEAALFAPSGTQANLIGLMSHCGRGDEYIVGHDAHTYRYEAGGAAVLASIQPQPLPFTADGQINLDTVATTIKPDDPHFATTRVLCLENTHHGRVTPLDYLAEARSFTNEHGLKLHLDGARVANAAAALDVPISTITQHVDSVSICLSKGLGAPVGSILCGSNELIARGQRNRKILGGGMRQAGTIAAAATIALTENVDRLTEDHARAQRLGKGLNDIDGVTVDLDTIDTNMVFADLGAMTADELAAGLAKRDILINGGYGMLRLVTHLDITDDDIDAAIEAIAEVVTG